MIDTRTYDVAKEQTSWWFKGRRKIAEATIRRLGFTTDQTIRMNDELAEILEVGCGSGAMLPTLAKYGAVTGIEIDSDLARLARDTHASAFVDVDEGDVRNLPVRHANRFDLVVAMDVIEHVSEDMQAVSELGNVTAPGGYLILTVPAMPSLWSRHDEELGHFRRYRAEDLRFILETAGGFVDIQISHFVSLSFPLAWTWRQAERVIGARGNGFEPQPAILNTALYGSLRLEGALMSRLQFPIGTSLIATARME